MRRVFADTGYWVSLLNHRDELYQKARDLSSKIGTLYCGNTKAAIIHNTGKIKGHKNMSQKTFEITQLSDNLIDLLSDIQNQTEVLLTREGVPLAKVMPLPVEPTVPPQVGLNYGAMVMSDDFDAPLPDDFWGV